MTKPRFEFWLSLELDVLKFACSNRAFDPLTKSEALNVLVCDLMIGGGVITVGSTLSISSFAQNGYAFVMVLLRDTQDSTW
ncbi:hypothetical protein VINI7043_25327 [Vibrio nigripulchritudo ATCC 27043]|nr:hypothetical protein VINI7043_25327 [Vibrio nigripulchritudo ATCC 27043]